MSSTSLELQPVELLPGDLLRALGAFEEILCLFDQHFPTNVAKGIQYRQEISAPAKAEYFLRVVVHDLTHDRLGAVEVATSEVKNLQSPSSSTPINAVRLPGSGAGNRSNPPPMNPSCPQ